MTATLGISCFYHDAAAALVCDGVICAAAQEERFTRKKGDPSFPISAITYCLEEARITVAELDSVVYYDRPGLTFDRLLKSFASVAPAGGALWYEAITRWLGEKSQIERIVRGELQESGLNYKGPILYTAHHMAHAAAAYFPSPFEDAAILTIDGVGEWATASYGIGTGKAVHVTHEMRFPDSLGLLYSAVLL